MTFATDRKSATCDALPVWNLDDLYPGIDSPELRTDIDVAADRAARFRERHAGQVSSLDGAALAEAISEYEGIEEILGACCPMPTSSMPPRSTMPKSVVFIRRSRNG